MGNHEQMEPLGQLEMTWSIRRLQSLDPSAVEALADVLIDVVEGGASIGFMHPLSRERAIAFWKNVAQTMDKRALLVAEDEKGICGTVQLVFAEPQNQPHRADVSKMIVHRRARGQGIAKALMRELENVARDHGKTLLVLDTADAAAEHVYERTGWQRLGTIPNYALMPDGAPCNTVVFYRDLRKTAAPASHLENIIPILSVQDVARSVAYYVDRLGFTNQRLWGEGFGGVSRDRLSIYFCKGSQGNAGTWIWAGVNDVEQLYEEFKKSGAKIRVPPRNYPWALEMHVEDPDGHTIRFGSEPREDEPFEEFIE
jgi:GNAT superfamily N-acetyltransferase/catechol 2,3-dioxygenase-like lactoylglutathione lyase family enzyme